VFSNLPQRDQLKEASVTVASLRLDCVVSGLASCSRNRACELIESGMVSLNSQITEKITRTITGGDVLSIRRKGKFQIISAQDKTKKDRIILQYKAY
jgi:RNA-binding protein YlmH